VSRILIVVLALIIAFSLAGGAFLVLSGDAEPPPPTPVGGPDPFADSWGDPVPYVPGPALPPAVDPPDADPEPVEGPSAPEGKPTESAVDREAAIATMKATLEGTTFSLTVEDLDVRAALGLIAALADVEINTNLADSAKLDGKVGFSFDGVGILDALEFICQMMGLKHEVGPRGIVIR